MFRRLHLPAAVPGRLLLHSMLGRSDAIVAKLLIEIIPQLVNSEKRRFFEIQETSLLLHVVKASSENPTYALNSLQFAGKAVLVSATFQTDKIE
jgi:hypothetical protein